MTHIEGFPLPATARHDEDGNHIPPYIPEWRRAAGTDRVVKGSEIERDQRQKAVFAAHLEEHRRRGEPASVFIELGPEDETIERGPGEGAVYGQLPNRKSGPSVADVMFGKLPR